METEVVKEYQSYLWVVAHPDDAEFSSAGTIAKFAKEGKKIVIIQVTSGDRGTSDRSVSPESIAQTSGSQRGRLTAPARRRAGSGSRLEGADHQDDSLSSPGRDRHPRSVPALRAASGPSSSGHGDA
jgi:LmbE family N-acetylglucosaminyl deacetylase